VEKFQMVACRMGNLLKHDLKGIASKAFDHGLTMKDGTAYDRGKQRFNGRVLVLGG
jgi:hypothetical protein